MERGQEQRKYRHEYKFLVNMKEMVLLENRIKSLVSLDSHARQGSYLIRSVYFDDINNTCYHQNEAGVDPRAKFRIRIYDAMEDNITLEKKSKKNGMTHKEAAKITKEQCDMLLMGQAPFLKTPGQTELPRLLQEFGVLVLSRMMRPKVIVEYERTPYIYQYGNVRITFDKNIASSREFGGFFEQRILKYPVMAAGQHIMEVKFDEYLPSFIKNQLELGTLTQTSFSKYYLCRRFVR